MAPRKPKPDAARGTASRRGLDALEAWLDRRRRLVLAVLIALSAALRVGYFLELSGTPSAVLHRWDQSDMSFFEEWGEDIAAGDALSERVRHPQHQWHQAIAKLYLLENPADAARLRATLPPDATDADLFRAVWNRWYGGTTFHQEPLYPYLVGLTHLVFGPDVRWIFAWQLLVGVAGNALVFVVARRPFGTLAATVAGILAVACTPILCYDMTLLRSTLVTFAGLALVALADVALSRGTWRWWLATGLAFGLALLLQATFALFLLGVVALLAWRVRDVRRVVPLAAALAGGVLIALSPAIVRNVAVGAPAGSLSSVGPVTFACANMVGYEPELGFVPGNPLLTKIMGPSDGRFLPVVVATLKTHSLRSYLEQEGRKLALAWHWYELPNNVNFYYFRLESRILRWSPVTFTLLAPLSLLGLVVAALRRARCGTLYLLVASTVAWMLVFYVLSRFRVALIAALLPFAGLAVVQLAEWIVTRRIRPLVTAVAALALVTAWTARPLPPHTPPIRPGDYTSAYVVYYDPIADAAAARGDWQGVADILTEALRLEPEVVREMTPARPAVGLAETQLGSWFASVHQRHARALQASGHQQEAEREWARTLELARAVGLHD